MQEVNGRRFALVEYKDNIPESNSGSWSRDFIEEDDYKLVNRKVEQVSGSKYIEDYYTELDTGDFRYFIFENHKDVNKAYLFGLRARQWVNSGYIHSFYQYYP